MPLRSIPKSNLKYYLVGVDGNGVERADDPDAVDGRLTMRIAERLAQDCYTDVFLMSHGWMGDIPAAIRQYDLWIGAMANCRDDVNRARQIRANFKPLLIGLHWPSLPFGEEEFHIAGGSSFAASGPAHPLGPPIAALVDAYAGRIADTPAARAALEMIFAAAAADAIPSELPPDVAAAYRLLDRESGLGAGGPGSAPGSDREPFDPETAYEDALADSEVNFGIFGLGPLVSLLQSLSFYRMKDRACMVGETSARTLIAGLQASAKSTGRDVRFHLMGHSFGCIVISAALAAPTRNVEISPVHSTLLAQGAQSLWSYCKDIPHAKGTPGYFQSMIHDRRVAGAIITTQSEHDTAVCKWYPVAAGARGDVTFAPGEFPKYGALGEFGARGSGVNAVDIPMLETSKPYAFERGRIYNINSSGFIADMQSRSSGAHNDIAHPQVAHAMWSAVLL